MSRLDRLELLRKSIENADHANDDAFARIVGDSMGELFESDGQFADLFGISRPTANRWKNGKTAPHPTMRAVVYARLMKATRTALTKENQLERLAVSSGGYAGTPLPAAASSKP